MLIEFHFTCRECASDVYVGWETSHDSPPVGLRCSSCGHVSGELRVDHVYREEHRPSWEREGVEDDLGSNG